jgi:hypothetical protein
MDNRSFGLLILGGAAVLAVVGLLVWSGGLSWFGRLPGDVRIARGATRVYVPWVSMLVVSLVLTLLLHLARRLL